MLTDPEKIKFGIYGTIVIAYMAAGILDLAGHNWKAGTTAIGFGILNVIIFFWRSD